jgi:hypothetical protein
VGRHTGKSRLHIDLNDARWSAANYKEEDWRPIVDFIKKYRNHILPSEAFKKLTPSTTWRWDPLAPEGAQLVDHESKAIVSDKVKIQVPPRRRFYKTPQARIKKRWPGDWDWQYLPIRELPLQMVPGLHSNQDTESKYSG